MSYTMEGLIEIDLADFYEWVTKEFAPDLSTTEHQYGIPKVNKENQTLEISFAAGTDGHPETWLKKPKAVAEWKQ